MDGRRTGSRGCVLVAVVVEEYWNCIAVVVDILLLRILGSKTTGDRTTMVVALDTGTSTYSGRDCAPECDYGCSWYCWHSARCSRRF